jgi:SAM-dependent methyltransferase
MNTFESKPEFVSSDIRTTRPASYMMPITTETMLHRHQLWFAKTDLVGKRVLDLGCCVGGTGAWVLDQGARHYTGVELQADFASLARQNLSKYYQEDTWTVVESDILGYLTNCQEQFDVVVLCGSLYAIFDYFSVLKNISRIAQEVIIESYHPYKGFKELYPEKSNTELVKLWNHLDIVSYETTGQTLAQGNSNNHDGVRPSMSSLKKIFGYLGWSTEFDLNDLAQSTLPMVYSLDTNGYAIRFVIRSIKNKKQTFDFLDSFTHKDEFPYEIKIW